MSRSPARGDRRADAPRLLIDAVACDGIGMCAYLARHLVALDTWGYPIVLAAVEGRADLRAAQAAVAGCPRRALILET